MKEEVRLGDGREGAQGGLSLSYFHFSVQPWIYQERFAEFRHIRCKKTPQICLLIPTPQYSAFIRPISANKPILSTLTVGFIPSTTQSASRKHNTHAGTGVQNYTHSHTKTGKKGLDGIKIFHTKNEKKKKTQIYWALLIILHLPTPWINTESSHQTGSRQRRGWARLGEQVRVCF